MKRTGQKGRLCAVALFVALAALCGCPKKQEPQAPTSTTSAHEKDIPQAVNGIQMFIKMKKEKYAEDEPVMFEVRLYNSGDKVQYVISPEDSQFLRWWSAGTVTNEKGDKMEWKGSISGVPPYARYVPKNAQLAPGAALTAEYDLREVCDLSPGKYTFRLTSFVFWPSPGGEKVDNLVSNEVRFEVVKAEDERSTHIRFMSSPDGTTKLSHMI